MRFCNIYTFIQESRVQIDDLLIPKLFNVEETTLSTHIAFTQVFNTIDDGSSGGSCYPVVIRLSNSTDSGDVSFLEPELCVICEGTSHSFSLFSIKQVILHTPSLPETPFSQKTKSGLNSMILSHIALTCSSSMSKNLSYCPSFSSSILV